MHVIVVGCGRVGSAVAQSLDQKGHEVVVVDRRVAPRPSIVVQERDRVLVVAKHTDAAD